MNEISKVLESNEKIEWEGKPKASAYFCSQIFGLVIFGGLGFLILNLTKTQNILWIGGIIFLLVAAIISGILNYKVTHYVLTNKRVIMQTGFIGRDFKSTDLDKIENVSVNVGLIDKIFKTGTIYLDMGNMAIQRGKRNMFVANIFQNISDPYELLKKIQTHLSKRKENLYSGKA